MSKLDVARKLISLDSSRVASVVNRSIQMYAAHISNIAIDIYDSCIEDYYAQYDPLSYGRHGNKTGFNLYSANNIVVEEFRLDVGFDPYSLLPYAGRKEKRKKVLDNVFAGLRGTGMRKWQTDWPREWRTSYPNEYSKYNNWESSGSTLNEIFSEFVERVTEETEDLLWEYIDQNI